MPQAVEFKFTNPDNSLGRLQLISFKFSNNFENLASEIEIKTAKSHTVLEDARVMFKVEGALKLIGQVDSIDEESDEFDIVTVTSAEKLFEERPGQAYTYPDGTTLNEMLSDDPPTAGGRVGMIYFMNSGLEPAWTLHSGYIYKLAGGGTTRLGSTDLYENDVKLTRATTLGGVTAGKYYQSTTDLYVWCTDNVDPSYRLMTAPNWRDTRVRLGTIANGSTSFAVPFKFGTESGMDTIIGILWAALLEAQFVPKVDGYVYLNASATIGRGSESSPVSVFSYGARNTTKIKKTVASGQLRVNSIVALGAGSGATQTLKAVSDLSSTKIGQLWRVGIYDAPGCSGAMLSNLASKSLTEHRDNKIYSIAGQADWALMPGDSIKAIPKNSAPVNTRIKAISYNWPDNTMTIEAGRRQLTLSEALGKKLDLLRTLSSIAQSIATQWSESFDGNVDDAHPLSTSFELPTDKIDTNFPHRFYVRLNIEAYETDTESVTTAAHNNGGVTGSHSGYGGHNTSAKTQLAHSVPSVTGYSYSSSYLVGSGSGSTDSRTASVSSYSASTNTISSHSHVYYRANSATGGHSHFFYSGTGYAVNPADHTHVIPSHSTYNAGDQYHETTHDSAKSRVVFTEPQTPAEMAEWIKTHDTGNSIHYLDVTIKLNGTEISGSPVLDLYIGDSTGELDVTTLIQEGENQVEVSIVDHSNPSDPVRCKISGSVGAEYYIDNYA